MQYPAIRGRAILVVKGGHLGMEIVEALSQAGAKVTMITSLPHAFLLVEHGDISAAVVDLTLGEGDRSELCARLNARGIPNMSYAGNEPVTSVRIDALLSAVEELLAAPER